jgi:hypothetical protein
MTGPFPRPVAATTFAEPLVRVTVNCDSNPETIRVKNNTNDRIRIKTIGSIYQPRSNEPFNIADKLGRAKARLGAGAARTFETGPAADRNVLTRQYIYNSSVGRQEGARVKFGGTLPFDRLVDRCD